MPTITIYKGAIPTKPKSAQKPKEASIGKTVFFRTAGLPHEIGGVVKEVKGGVALVSLAVPNHSGVLVVARDAVVEVPVEDLNYVEALAVMGRDVREWSSSNPVENMKAVEVKDTAGNVIDYRDVTFDGYGSTFQGTTPADRDNDYILPGAFDKTLKEFRSNPVLLTDHDRRVAHMMGSYSKIGITERGLALTGNLTNSQHPDAQHVRALVYEKHLKTLSIGGMFFYLEDYRGIEEIRLYEVSLVTVPANHDAMFNVRTLNVETAAKAFKLHASLHGGEVRSKVSLSN